MTRYSPLRFRVFDTCRLRYRYQYVDKARAYLRPADTAGSLSPSSHITQDHGLNQALGGESGVRYIPAEGDEHVVAYAPIAPAGWGLVIEERWDDLMVARSGEPTKQDDMLAIYNSLGWFLGIFAILMGGLGMMNAMLMSVFERTREIGVLRALGWRRRQVMVMVCVESLALSLLSAGLGILLGVGLAALFQLDPTMGSFLVAAYSPRLFLEVLALALGLGAIGGLYPAWRAANLRPIEALRYE